MKLGLQTRLVLLFAAFGVLATGFTGLYAYRQSRNLLVQAAERDLMATTQMFGRRVGAVFGRIGADAREAAQWRLTREVAAGGDARQQALLADIFKATLGTNPRYLQVRLIGAEQHGLELVRIDREADHGVVVEGDALQEKGHFPYMFRSLQLQPGQVFLSKIGLEHEAGSHAALNRPILHVASPVVADDGRKLGAVVIGVDVGLVFDDLRAGIPSHLRLLLANEWGDFLIHPDPAQAFAFEQGQRVLLQESFAGVEPLLHGDAPPVLARAELSDGKRADRVLAAFVHLKLSPDAKGGDAVLGIAEPLQEIVRATAALGRTTAQIVAAFSAIAIALAILAARLVTRPLQQMTREVQRFTVSVAELQASREQLAEQARRDPLTGLHNRSSFIDRLDHAIATARRTGSSFALLFVDLDRFKQVNDLYGHAVGDTALHHAARLLQGAVREADTVGRVGGDEFVILLEAVHDERDAGRVAQALLERFAEPIRVGGHEIALGLSVGISLFPRDGLDAAALMQRADEAMYRSKSGGNRYSVFGNLDFSDEGTPS